METKTCTGCGDTKPLSAFHAQRGRKAGRSRCATCTNARIRSPEYRKTENDRVTGRRKAERLALRRAQKYRCAICQRHERTVGVLVRDHCHTSGRVRKMLCQGCNLALGHFQDNIDTMAAAIAYLREYA